MGQIITQIASPPDRDIVKAWTAAATKLAGAQPITLSFSVGSTDPISVSGQLPAVLAEPVVRRLQQSRSSLITQSTFTMKPMSAVVARQQGSATLTINFPSSGNHDASLEFIEAVKAAFAQFDPLGGLTTVLGPELSEFYRKREEAVIRLETLAESLIGRTEEYRQDLDRRFEERRATLDARTEALRVELEVESRTRAEELSREQAALEARAKELDDRSSRHARRDLRTQLKQILKERNERFSLTSDTQRKRLPIHALFGLLLIVGGVFTFDVIRDALATEVSVGWPIVLRTALAFISFGATTAFYIRWNDSWARKHAEEEFRLRQLEIDVDRASWVVEMALEWKDEEGGVIPDMLVDRLTRGLFDGEGDDLRVRHPAEDLASALVGATSGLAVTVPGLGELRLDRRGVQKFKRAVEEAE